MTSACLGDGTFSKYPERITVRVLDCVAALHSFVAATCKRISPDNTYHSSRHSNSNSHTPNFHLNPRSVDYLRPIIGSAGGHPNN